MAKRNFRYLGDKQEPTVTDGSGIAELYDVYTELNQSVRAYPGVLQITSSWDSATTIPAGSSFGATYTFSNYYIADSFTTSIAFNGSAASSDFEDSVGSTFSVGVDLATGLASYSLFNIYRIRSGVSASNNNQTFDLELRDSSNNLVHSKTLTIVDGSYTLTPVSYTVNEGAAPQWTLSYSGAPPSQSIWYGFSGQPDVGGTVGVDDWQSSSLSGTVTSSSTGSGSATITAPLLANDFTTEGTETVQCKIAHHFTYNFASYYLVASNINVNDTSQDPTATITPSTNFNINEGSSQTFTVTMTNYSSGSVPYEIIMSPEAEESDINVPLVGNINISSSTGSISITATADGYTETGQSETFYVQVKHPNGSGVLLAQSGTATINDTSTGTPEPAGIDITSAFFEFSNRAIASNTYMGGSADYNGPYDVAEVQQGSFSGSGRIYLAHKVTSPTTYYSDAPIAAVQLLSSSGSVLQTWAFNTSTGGSGSTWSSLNQQLSPYLTTGLPVAPTNMTSYSFTGMTTSSSTGRFSWATSTGSSFTGAADGIATPTGAMPVGNGTIAQSAGTYFMYRETSGSTLNSTVVCRSPLYTFSGGERIRIAHALTSNSANSQNPDESLWVGVAS